MAFAFNLDEKFPHLSKAPIVEAVVQINARATTEWTQGEIMPSIQREVGDDILLQPENASQQGCQLDPVQSGASFLNVPELSSFQGKTVRVVGKIELFKGKPEIRVSSRSQILDGD
jgi:hypothetical protein